MKSKIINLNSNNIKIITRSLLIGKTIVIPTDTVYGIAADAKSFQGVENIFKIKKRPKRFPLILFTHSIAEAKKLAIFSPFEEYLASKYWPGPLTLILKKKGKKFYNGDKRLSKVGIRIPKNKDVIIPCFLFTTLWFITNNMSGPGIKVNANDDIRNNNISCMC